MKIFLILLLSISLFGDIYKELAKSDRFTYEQKLTIAKAYRYGEPYDLGYTMAAIAIVESRAGDCIINLNDPSFGVYHNLLSSVIKRKHLRNTKANQNMIAHKLLTDFSFSSQMCLEELQYWKRYHKNWKKMIMSYNAGFKYQNGRMYLKKIRKEIRFLRGGKM